MMDCETCTHKDLPSFSETCVECGIAMRNYKPITNADRLRSMSDEEFATAICKHEGCPFREAEDDECLKHHYDCKACWLDWLKQEAEEGE